ncbi:hypothetical protein BY458DRAFT_546294 [Sporodiniella umbellata]|nr:hypothetical protein BY458DRAFT_546294 [Sporodiniella umbellata]
MSNALNYPTLNHDQSPLQGTEVPLGWHFLLFPLRIPEKSVTKDGCDADWKPAKTVNVYDFTGTTMPTLIIPFCFSASTFNAHLISHDYAFAKFSKSEKKKRPKKAKAV